jgi:hypothetical protein
MLRSIIEKMGFDRKTVKNKRRLYSFTIEWNKIPYFTDDFDEQWGVKH